MKGKCREPAACAISTWPIITAASGNIRCSSPCSPEKMNRTGATARQQGNLRLVTSRVSPNGEYVAFMSDRGLTGYDNHDASSGVPTRRSISPMRGTVVPCARRATPPAHGRPGCSIPCSAKTCARCWSTISARRAASGWRAACRDGRRNSKSRLFTSRGTSRTTGVCSSTARTPLSRGCQRRREAIRTSRKGWGAALVRAPAQAKCSFGRPVAAWR